MCFNVDGLLVIPRAGWRCWWRAQAGFDRMGSSAFVGRHGIRLACLALIAIMVSGAGFLVWDMHERTVANCERDANILGTVLAERTTRYVQVVDRVLQELQLRVRMLDIRRPEDFQARLGTLEIHNFLLDRMQNLPPANAFILIDATGRTAMTSRSAGLKDIDASDADFVRHFATNDDPGLFVSETRPGKITGMPTVFVARRINALDGQFLGVAVGAIDAGDLSDFHRAINTRPGQAVMLLRRDGIVLTRDPDPTQVAGRRMPAVSPWYGLVQAGGGGYRTPGFFAGYAAIVSVHPLHVYPLVIDVSIQEHGALAAWRLEARFIGISTICVAASLLVLFGVIDRQMRRQKDHNAALSRTADALRSSKVRLRDFAELASDWFWEQDAELRFTDVGTGAPMRARDDRSFVGKRRWELTDISQDTEAWEKHQLDMLTHRRFHEFRYERIGVNGRQHHLSVSGKPLYDAGGTFLGYRGIGRDVTMEVEAEADLRKTKDRAEQAEMLLRDAVDSMSEGFVIFDHEDRLVMCNETYRQLYPESADVLVPGVLFEDVIRHIIAKGGYVAARGCEPEWLAERLRCHQEANGAIEQSRGNGSWMLMIDRRMRNGGIAGLRIDITALKRAQAALRESEAHLELAQEITGIGSWELDLASGDYIWSRQCYRILGLPPDFKPTREGLASSVHADDFQRLSDWLADLQGGRKRNATEVRIKRPCGEVRMLCVNARPVADPDGVIRRLTGTTQDITEQRLIERHLAQVQKMEAIGNLTGGMAHDFNNVLGVIIGNLDLLKRLVEADATASELCDEALNGATRGADLIRRLLAFARRQSLHPEQTDANALVSDIVRLLGRILGEDITLKLDLDAALWPVLADPAQLEAVLVNLAANARDAMPAGGQLDIITRNVQLDARYAALHPEATPGAYAIIEISDIGTGIPPEIIGRIFEPFFTTKEPGKGTGLGLSMAFGFVKQSGGHLSVYSEPGLGSTFRLYLPRSDAGETVPARVSDASAVVGGGETVLVVEDNAPLRRAAERQLTALGYQVREAEHAAAALVILSRGDRVDLLFTDVVMPGTMGGIDLATQVTRLRPGVKALLTSGFPGVRGGNHRVTDCLFPLLNKPYRHEELARTVRAVLDRDDDEPPATAGCLLAGSDHGGPGSSWPS